MHTALYGVHKGLNALFTDFAGWVLSFMGGKGKTPEVAKLYGKKLDTQNLMELRQQRLMANQFMETAASVAARRTFGRAGSRNAANPEKP